ncbi:MAG: Tn3 family transposase, partial [Actinomycetota bacterium]
PYPHARQLITGRVDTNLITSQWDDLLRVAASLQRGWVSGSLLLERWQARPRQNPLTRALQEYGRLQRTLFLLHYLASPDYRREIGRQLNRGETFHDLRQRVRFGQRGHVRRPHLDEQTVEALALNLVVAAITCWNTHYIADIIDQLRTEGWTITDEQIAHLSPALWRHINFLGSWRFDHQPPNRHRPLRHRRP